MLTFKVNVKVKLESKTFTKYGAYDDLVLYCFSWHFRQPSWFGGHFVENHYMGITLRFTIRIGHMIA